MALTLLEPIIVNTAANFTFANASITNSISAGNVKTDNLLYANGSPYIFTSSAAGSNTQVQFNDDSSFAGSANFTFNKSSNTLTVTNIIADGSGLSNLTGSNVTGTVPLAAVANSVDVANVSNIGNIATLNIDGNASNILYGNGSFATAYGNSNVATFLASFGSNTITTTGNVSVGNIIGNGQALTGINGSNVTGTVANATHAGTANTVTTNAQPNITSVGLLAALSVGPNSSITLTGDSGFVKANSLQGTDGVNSIYLGYDDVSGAAGVKTDLTVGIDSAGNITANGNVTADYFIGNGSSLSSITGSNVTGQVGNALVAGTVYTNAQPNITSVGTLTDISVSGNASIGGNLTVSGTTTYVNVTTLAISDPIIQLQRGPNGAAPSANTGKDVGTALNYYNTEARVAFMGWDDSNVEFGFGDTVTIADEVVTFTSYGNIRAGHFIGNGSALSSINGSNVTGTVANATHAETAGSATTASTVTANDQANITSVGTLSNLTSNGTINFTGASNVSLGGVGNVKITGGSSGQYITTDGNGNISFASISISSISNGNSNVSIPAASGNIAISAVGNANVLIVTGTGINVAGTLNASGDANVGNLGTNVATITTGNINTINSGLIQNGNSNITITANANVTISATGGARITATSTGANITGTLGVSGNANVANLGTAQVLASANITAPVLISNTATGTAPFIVTSTTQVANLNVATAGSATTAGTVTTNAQPNITSTGTLTSLTVSGTTSLQQSTEVVVPLTGATGTVTHNFSTGTVFYHSSIAGSFTPNFTNVPTTNNQVIVCGLILAQGGTAYVPGATVQIDGVSYTVKWPNATAPTGTASGIDTVSYALLRVGGAWTVTGQYGTFS